MNDIFDIDAFRALVGDPSARRELLWLHAKEKEDEENAAALECLDLRIVERLRAAGHEIDAIPDETPGARRERFARISDECYGRQTA